MAYPIKTDIVPLLRHLAEALMPVARANFVGLAFETEAEGMELSFLPEDIVKSVGQILCQVIAFTPSGYEVRLSVELPGEGEEEQLLIGISNTGVSLAILQEITAGLPLPVEVKGRSGKGTRFELRLPLAPEEEAVAESAVPAPPGSGGGNVPILFQKLRSRMRAYASSMKSLEEAVARQHGQQEQVFLKKVNAIILANLSREDFDVRALARSLALSRTQLYRRLKPLIQQPPSRYIRFVRLQKAKAYLEKGEMTVSDVCFQVGFTDKSHFTRAFKQQFGFSPSYLRKNSIVHHG
ncbi:MAG: helix-turn-helix domain-containing protein [Lewinellaceae bacterium]|nr:helix-turn-helix domain-containing protein [Lewinellaceae bacterium]